MLGQVSLSSIITQCHRVPNKPHVFYCSGRGFVNAIVSDCCILVNPGEGAGAFENQPCTSMCGIRFECLAMWNLCYGFAAFSPAPTLNNNPVDSSAWRLAGAVQHQVPAEFQQRHEPWRHGQHQRVGRRSVAAMRHGT